jgi:hypothetical protein
MTYERITLEHGANIMARHAHSWEQAHSPYSQGTCIVRPAVGKYLEQRTAAELTPCTAMVAVCAGSTGRVSLAIEEFSRSATVADGAGSAG